MAHYQTSGSSGVNPPAGLETFKKEVFKVVLMRSMASEDDALVHLKLNIISRQDAIAIMRGE
jgi:hypothetical protein